MTTLATHPAPAGRPLIGLAVLAISLCVPRGSQAQAPELGKALGVAETQARRTIAVLGDSVAIPRYTRPDGRWQTSTPSEWTSGFFPGTLWYLYENSGDTLLKDAAGRWTAAVEGQKLNSRTHDVGFMIYCSFGNGHRITGDPRYKEVLLQAARTLAGRFNPDVGCIKSWDWPKQWPFPVIVDNMMNLELLMWASKNGGGDTLAAIARSHALRTIENHFRPDGSTYHVVDYDPRTGALVTRQTHQGSADSSVWARGQAWAIYGFTVMYRETRDPRFLGAARRAADYFLGHLPPDRIPYWDFDAPGIPNEPRDASAAAIAASGMIELSQLSPDTAGGNRYRRMALEILGTLCSSNYLADPAETYGMLKHAVGNKPANKEVDVSLVYGDYYFVEALIRATDATSRPMTVTVTNPLPELRGPETIEVPLASLLPLRPPRLVVHESGQPLVSQLLDTGGDGVPDLLLFQASFGPLEKKMFTVRAGSPGHRPDVTDARFVLPRQDLAWENDRIAFRMYGSVLAGDVNNGIDVWCKRVRYPIVEKWYAGSAKAGKDSYHEDRGEGADFFSVGRSLGAGSCAPVAGDSLMQPGLFTGHRVLGTGPVRALFELRYDSARAGARRYQVLKRISLDAGSHLNRIEVRYKGFPAGERLTVAAGLVRRANVSRSVDPENRWIALWGPTNADTVNGLLGTGIVMPASGAVRDSDRHLMVTAPARPDVPFTYHSGAAWTRAGDVTSPSAWEALLQAAARCLAAPLSVTVTKGSQ